MPKRTDIKKIMVIGSGPIIIGQAAEFDYAGTQACLALKEEGYSVVLVNSNPATIMTDKEIADQVYIEPLTLEFVTRIIRKERPDALLPTLGGQTGLNMAMVSSSTCVGLRYGYIINNSGFSWQPAHILPALRPTSRLQIVHRICLMHSYLACTGFSIPGLCSLSASPQFCYDIVQESLPVIHRLRLSTSP